MIRILYVDDESTLLEVTKIYLEQSGEFFVDTALSAEDALARLGDSGYEAVISDYQMPGMDGLKFLKALREKYPLLPFILFTGKGREEVAIEALNSGADFYLQKGGEPRSQFAELKNKLQQLIRRRAAEKALAESQEKYRDLVENINEVPFITDTEGSITYISPMVSQFGLPITDLTGKALMDFVVPEDRFDIRERLAAIREGNAQRVEFRIRSPSGKIFWARVSSRPILENGQFLGAHGILTDITGQKEMEAALKTSEEHYRGIVDNAPMGIFHSTSEGELIDTNPAFARIFGYDSPEDIVGTVNRQGGTATLYGDPEKRQDLIRQARETGGWQSSEIQGRKKDGSTFFCMLSFRTYGNREGRTELEGFVVDINESRKSQARIAASERRYHNVFDSASDALLVVDCDSGGVLDANRAALALYQYTLEEFRGIKYRDLSSGTPAAPDSTEASEGYITASSHRKKTARFFRWR